MMETPGTTDLLGEVFLAVKKELCGTDGLAHGGDNVERLN
jgi:hypothetical protein